MPFIVDKVCQSCDHRWEAWLKTRKDQVECPQCKSKDVEWSEHGGTALVTKCHDPEARSENLKKLHLMSLGRK